jgi:hypothetical protein
MMVTSMGWRATAAGGVVRAGAVGQPGHGQVAQTGAAADCLVSRNWSIASLAQSEV